LKRVPIVLVASLYEFSRPSSSSGLLHDPNHEACTMWHYGGSLDWLEWYPATCFERQIEASRLQLSPLDHILKIITVCYQYRRGDDGADVVLVDVDQQHGHCGDDDAHSRRHCRTAD